MGLALELNALGACAAMLMSACGAAPQQAAQADRPANGSGKENMMSVDSGAINTRFRTLDEYLAFLERTQAPVDGPWYREIRPGVYELQTGNLRVLGGDSQPKRVFTRDELEREFGFRK